LAGCFASTGHPSLPHLFHRVVMVWAQGLQFTVPELSPISPMRFDMIRDQEPPERVRLRRSVYLPRAVVHQPACRAHPTHWLALQMRLAALPPPRVVVEVMVRIGPVPPRRALGHIVLALSFDFRLATRRRL